MNEVARCSKMFLAAPVYDLTGLKGRYEFTLRWIVTGVREEIQGPDIAQALQGQLGLKFRPRKDLTDVIAIDHVEKVPTPN
jgi:uncharacterized protein (TIGR03435 family)